MESSSFVFDVADALVDALKIDSAIRDDDDLVCLAGARELGLLAPCTDRPDAHAESLRGGGLTDSADVLGKVHSTDCAIIAKGLQAL